MTKLLSALVVVAVGLMFTNNALATHAPPGTKLLGYEASNFPSRILQYNIGNDMFETSCVPPGSQNGRGIEFDPGGGGFLWYTFVTPAPTFLGDGLIHKTSLPPACANMGQIPFGDGPGGVDQDDIGALDLDPDNGDLWAAGYHEWPTGTNHQVLYQVSKSSGAILKACWVPDQGIFGEGNDTLAVKKNLPGQPSGKYLLTDGGTSHNTEMLYAVDAASAANYTTPAAVPPCAIPVAYDPPVGLTGIDFEETAPFDLIGTDAQFIYDLDGPPFTGIQAVMSAAPTMTLVDITLGPVVTGGEPFTLTLEPKEDVNEVETQHCVTATVQDQSGQPVPGVTVVFDVEGASEIDQNPPDEDGTATTNDQGVATFCYTGPDLPGKDVIEAFADTDEDGMQDAPPPLGNEPFDIADKAWVLPVSTPLCEVRIDNGGWIYAMNGDASSFGGTAKADGAGNASGNEEYQDHGPAFPMNLHGNVLAVLCDSATEATIYGLATVDGSPVPLFFRVRVQDNGEGGTAVDEYGIIVANGYASGDQPLQGGNVQIHSG
jgi:hypothetical protein